MSSRRSLQLEFLESRDLFAVMTDGPLVGAVSDTAAKIFLRTDDKANVAVQYSTSPTFDSLITTPSVKAVKDNDYTSILPLSGLSAETKYYYRTVVNGVPQQTSNYPSFTTFAPANSSRSFSFDVMADLDITDPKTRVALTAPAYAAMAADSPSFVIQAGDFPHAQPGKLSKMRTMNRNVRGDLTLAGAEFQNNIADQFPVYHVWDDHDYGPNNGDKTFGHKAEALRAFNEYWPTPTRPNAAGIWHSFSYAQADVFMLDLRSQRDPYLEVDGAAKSILDGDNIANGQKAWLQAGLLNSTATWKFIISSVPFNPTVRNKDGWTEYATERTELVNYINSNNIKNVIFISGDLHYGGALDTGANAGFPEMNLPHTNLQNNHVNTVKSVGTWDTALFSGANNPGYGRVIVTPDQVTLQVKGADGSVRASMTINASTSSSGFLSSVETSHSVSASEVSSVARGLATPIAAAQVSAKQSLERLRLSSVATSAVEQAVKTAEAKLESVSNSLRKLDLPKESKAALRAVDSVFARITAIFETEFGI